MGDNRSVILTYHSLDDSESAISIAPRLFRQHMDFLAASGLAVLPLDQALQRPGSVAITFDDGFRNFLDLALPELALRRLPATIFIVSGYCGRRNLWPARPYRRIPRQPLLGWDELSAMPALISLGAHTVTHPDLRGVSPAECEKELRECQAQIEQRTGRPVRWLAYPYGASSPTVRSLAGRYFDLAVGTSLQFVSTRSNPLDLPRIDAYYFGGRFPLKHLFTPYGSLYIGLRHLLRNVRRLASR